MMGHDVLMMDLIKNRWQKRRSIVLRRRLQDSRRDLHWRQKQHQSLDEYIKEKQTI